MPPSEVSWSTPGVASECHSSGAPRDISEWGHYEALRRCNPKPLDAVLTVLTVPIFSHFVFPHYDFAQPELFLNATLVVHSEAQPELFLNAILVVHSEAQPELYSEALLHFSFAYNSTSLKPNFHKNY